MNTTALITIADTLVPVAATEDGKAYLSPKAICDSLGISWPGQFTKIKEDAVLSSCVTEIEMQVGGQRRKLLMLPKEMVPGWLFTIKKVAPEVQAKLNRFRLECFVALDTWFNKGLRRNETVMQQYDVPRNFKEALLALVAAEDEKERLEAEAIKQQQLIATMTPKVNAWDKLVAADGCICSRDLASCLGLRSAQELHKRLHKCGFIYPRFDAIGRAKGWLVRADHAERGFHRTSVESHNGVVACITRWTPAGAAFIAELLAA